MTLFRRCLAAVLHVIAHSLLFAAATAIAACGIPVAVLLRLTGKVYQATVFPHRAAVGRKHSAVVFGATTLEGEAVVRHLSDLGCTVHACDSDGTALRELYEQRPSSVPRDRHDDNDHDAAPKIITHRINSSESRDIAQIRAQIDAEARSLFAVVVAGDVQAGTIRAAVSVAERRSAGPSASSTTAGAGSTTTAPRADRFGAVRQTTAPSANAASRVKNDEELGRGEKKRGGALSVRESVLRASEGALVGSVELRVSRVVRIAKEFIPLLSKAAKAKGAMVHRTGQPRFVVLQQRSSAKAFTAAAAVSPPHAAELETDATAGRRLAAVAIDAVLAELNAAFAEVSVVRVALHLPSSADIERSVRARQAATAAAGKQISPRRSRTSATVAAAGSPTKVDDPISAEDAASPIVTAGQRQLKRLFNSVVDAAVAPKPKATVDIFGVIDPCEADLGAASPMARLQRWVWFDLNVGAWVDAAVPTSFGARKVCHALLAPASVR